jgi:hypothetical protein
MIERRPAVEDCGYMNAARSERKGRRDRLAGSLDLAGHVDAHAAAPLRQATDTAGLAVTSARLSGEAEKAASSGG